MEPFTQTITHIRQTGDWDCGIACVQMILGKGKQLPPQSMRSVWTVDLAYLLHSYGVKFYYTTVTLGANMDYSGVAFYSSIHEDAQRVDKLFNDAAGRGIRIEKKSVDLADIVAHVKAGGACIPLVDMNYLVCNKCAPKWWKKSAERVLPPSSYRGHYVVLIGWNEEKNEFTFRDPDRADATCIISGTQLDTARKRFGTDEDMIWIDAAQLSTVVPP